MDSMRTLDGYGRVDELQRQAVQVKRPHRRLMLIAISSIVLVAILVGTIGSNERSLSTKAINDLKISLASAMTLQGRCLHKLDKLNETTTLVEGFKGLVKNSTEFVSNSLEIVTNFDFILLNFNKVLHLGGRRLLTYIKIEI
ncbi:hypothetical protein Ancab_000453 [Ancistrocladus abbreviatus]